MQSQKDTLTIHPVLFFLCMVAFVAALGLAMVPTASGSQIVISWVVIIGVALWTAYDVCTHINLRPMERISGGQRKLEDGSHRRGPATSEDGPKSLCGDGTQRDLLTVSE